MIVDTNKERLNINKLICEKEENIFVEKDMIVPDSKPDILSTISTSSNICIYKKELMDEKIKIDGNINAYIMYLADDSQGNVRGINVDLDFSKTLDAPNCNENMILDLATEIKSIECNVINGRKINIKAGVSVKYKIYSNENVEMINEIINNNDIQVLKDNIKVISLVGYRNSKAYVKDTIMIDNTDNLAEILKVNINMIDKDVKTSYNKVLAKTEAEVKIMYLTEDNRIVTCTNKIPVVGFVDIQNVSEDNICDTNFEIKNMVIKPNSVEEHSIYIELEIEVSCFAYEEKNINILQDFYSPTQELKCNKKEIETISSKKNRETFCHINETVNVPEIVEKEMIDVDCIPKITNINKLSSKIMYEGEVEIIFSFINENMQIGTSIKNIPFKFTIDDIKNDENTEISTNLEIQNQDCIIKQGGDITVDIDIKFSLRTHEKINLRIVDSIEVEEDRNTEDYSLIIYIVKPGDTLWKIAKNLKSTIDDIVKANAIENENIIHAGEKLYIPKYTRIGGKEQANVPMMNYA